MKSVFCLIASGLEPPLRFTSTRTFIASSSPTRRSTVSAVGPVWLWMSTTGNFAFGTRCCSVTSVDRGR